MTKKHYKVLAVLIGTLYGMTTIGDEEAVWNLIDSFVVFCQKDNPRFDADKFWDAVYTARDAASEVE